MKNRKKLILTLTIIFIVALALLMDYLINGVYLFSKRYDSPTEAMIKTQHISEEDVLGVLESNGFATALYMKDSNVYAQKFTNKNGWIEIKKDSIFNFLISKNKRIDRYIFVYSVYNGKHTISASCTNIDEQDIIEPRDNLSSKFEHIQIEKGESVINKWLLVLDELPENYSVFIGDEEIKLTKQ